MKQLENTADSFIGHWSHQVGLMQVYLLVMARHKKRLNRRQLITHLHKIFCAICRKKKVCLTCGRGTAEARVRADEKETLNHCNSLA